MSFVNIARCFVPQKVINVFWHWPRAFLAQVYFGFPGKKLRIIGVTGTDGKTTTVSLIYEILKIAGRKAAMVSTTEFCVADRHVPTGFHVTSPEPWKVQSFLKEALDAGSEFVVLEATSHGLDQNRFLGLDFEVGVITNVTHEHLDYHGTWERYFRAKRKLFDRSRWWVINRDDERVYKKLRSFIRDKTNKYISYGLSERANFRAVDIKKRKNGYEFALKIRGQDKSMKFSLPLLGFYNVHNALAAITTARILGTDWPFIRRALARFGGVRGRMEELALGQQYRAIVDFAHTPNALKKALETAREITAKNGRVIVVFGCAGLRDKGKRPIMGQTANMLADIVVLTAEDPRTEDVNKIIDDIKSGITRQKVELMIEPDRKRAICLAVAAARPGDVLILCGKGHEQSMCIGKTEIPWSDRAELEQAIKERMGKK